MTKWTSEEEDWLKQNFRFLPQEEIIIRLDRKWSHIWQKAKRLGLKRSKIRSYSEFELTEIEKAYIAGLVDGEACIGIYEKKKKDGTSNQTAQFIISMSDKEVIEWIAMKLGLKVYHIRLSKKNPNHKDQYRIDTCRTDLIRRLLLDLKPYLKIKYKDANKALDFIQLYKYNGK
ncbi:MAG: hypothetical protein KKD44_28170 [Proteobacteria bacterium]|nr:hypothetical protein [Pseudomonadota bacterium]